MRPTLKSKPCSITKLLPVVLSGAAHLQTCNVVQVKWPLVANLMFRPCCYICFYLSTTQSGFEHSTSNKELDNTKSIYIYTDHTKRVFASTTLLHFLFNISIAHHFDTVNNLDTIETGHMYAESMHGTCLHSLPTFPVYYVVLKTIWSWVELGDTSMHSFERHWEGLTGKWAQNLRYWWP